MKRMLLFSCTLFHDVMIGRIWLFVEMRPFITGDIQYRFYQSPF